MMAQLIWDCKQYMEVKQGDPKMTGKAALLAKDGHAQEVIAQNVMEV